MPPASLAGQWSALDKYAVAHAYYAAYGDPEFPKFYSNGRVFSKGVLSVEHTGSRGRAGRVRAI